MVLTLQANLLIMSSVGFWTKPGEYTYSNVLSVVPGIAQGQPG